MPALRSYNKVILVGNLTRDPELRYTTSNTPVAVFTVATNRVWVNSNGERKEEASFHRVNVWGKAAESLSKILHKGIKVLVEGILVYREVRDDSGKLVRREARIRAESVIILDKKNSNNNSGNSSQNAQSSETQVSTSEDVNTDSLDIDDIAKELENGSEEPVETKESGSSEDSIDESDLPF